MLTLALDTTSRRGSLAVARDGEVIEAVAVEAANGFAQIIYQQIEQLLDRNSLKLADIDCYAAASGPGSFTGIRIGLTAAKAFAEVHGKKVAPVSNLLALASLGEGAYRAPVLDARRGEVYAAVYDERMQPVIDEVAAPWASFLNSVAGREITFVGLDETIFEPGGAAEWQASFDSRWKRLVVTNPLAVGVAKMAKRAYDRNALQPPDSVDANYVRRSDAELNWKDPAKPNGTEPRAEARGPNAHEVNREADGR